MKNILCVQFLKDYSVNQTECQLNKIRNDVTDSKLVLFSNVLRYEGHTKLSETFL